MFLTADRGEDYETPYIYSSVVTVVIILEFSYKVHFNNYICIDILKTVSGSPSA